MTLEKLIGYSRKLYQSCVTGQESPTLNYVTRISLSEGLLRVFL